MKSPSNEAYLGDGVYAEFDGFGITLYTDRLEGRHWIYFEPDVMKALDEFRKQISPTLTPAEEDGLKGK